MTSPFRLLLLLSVLPIYGDAIKCWTFSSFAGHLDSSDRLVECGSNSTSCVTLLFRLTDDENIGTMKGCDSALVKLDPQFKCTGNSGGMIQYGEYNLEKYCCDTSDGCNGSATTLSLISVFIILSGFCLL